MVWEGFPEEELLEAPLGGGGASQGARTRKCNSFFLTLLDVPLWVLLKPPRLFRKS